MQDQLDRWRNCRDSQSEEEDSENDACNAGRHFLMSIHRTDCPMTSVKAESKDVHDIQGEDSPWVAVYRTHPGYEAEQPAGYAASRTADTDYTCRTEASFQTRDPRNHEAAEGVAPHMREVGK